MYGRVFELDPADLQRATIARRESPRIDACRRRLHCGCPGRAFAQQVPTGSVTVRVVSEGKPLAQAEIRLGTVTVLTSAQGEAVIEVPAGDPSV